MSLAATSAGTSATGPSGTRRLAVLLYDGPAVWTPFQDELRTEMAELGWIEGRTLATRWQFADGDAARLRTLARELVAARPDAILTRGTPATQALQRATTSLPILTGVGDPIGAGFAQSYAAPGGNITGISFGSVEASLKHVEVLRALVPGMSTLLVVLPADRVPFKQDLMRPIEAAARNVALPIRVVSVGTHAELRDAFATGRGRADVAAFVFGISQIEPKATADLALTGGMPTMFVERAFVDAGGLASYRLYWDRQTRRTAAQIDKVFRGEAPARIPFELPTRSELVLNKATAQALRLTIPQSLLLRADAVVG